MPCLKIASSSPFPCLFFILFLYGANGYEHNPAHDGSDRTEAFSNEWIVQLDGPRAAADDMALAMGYENMGELKGFPGYYRMKKIDHPEENRKASTLHTRSLNDQVRVVWAQQLFRKIRVKRRPPSPAEEPLKDELRPLVRVKRSLEDELLYERRIREQNLRARSLRRQLSETRVEPLNLGPELRAGPRGLGPEVRMGTLDSSPEVRVRPLAGLGPGPLALSPEVRLKHLALDLQAEVEPVPLAPVVKLRPLDLELQALDPAARVRPLALKPEPRMEFQALEPKIRVEPLAVGPESSELLAEETEDQRGIPEEILAIWEEEEQKYLDKRIFHGADENAFNDKLWDHQWYMRDTRSRSSLPEISLHVLQAFRMGYTGKNVSVCVIDDGLEHTHEDLSKNYAPEISFDYNSGPEGDPDPMPRYPENPEAVQNSHGTRCAGEIAMVANNKICGVGVAYDARIGGIRMLDGTINDRVEGSSLQHALDKVDIFTASWGPSDDGKTVEAPGRLALEAFENGVTKGRQGKGTIYVWAAGNGGMHHDNCNCDGYTSSRYTVSIGSTSEQGLFPWYGEKCSSTMASTYSSGAYTDQKIATTDNNNTCTVSHTGTSAAAPLAAGIIALALEANPSLTWRDVQHLVVLSSSSSSVSQNPGWQTNGAGLDFNSRFGFGIMNAEKMVKMAEEWRNVGSQLDADVGEKKRSGNYLSSNHSVIVEFDVTEENFGGIRFLEHVECTVNVQYPKRGAVEVVLVSPRNTISQLLTLRPEDTSDAGFKNWRFMSVHFWGENPLGTWKLFIVDRVTTNNSKGAIGDLTLHLLGTKEQVSSPKRRSDESTVRETRTRSLRTMEDYLASDNEEPLQADLADTSRAFDWGDLIGKTYYSSV